MPGGALGPARAQQLIVSSLTARPQAKVLLPCLHCQRPSLFPDVAEPRASAAIVWFVWTSVPRVPITRSISPDDPGPPAGPWHARGRSRERNRAGWIRQHAQGAGHGPISHKSPGPACQRHGRRRDACLQEARAKSAHPGLPMSQSAPVGKTAHAEAGVDNGGSCGDGRSTGPTTTRGHLRRLAAPGTTDRYDGQSRAHRASLYGSPFRAHAVAVPAWV